MPGPGFGSRRATQRGGLLAPAPAYDFVIDTALGNDAHAGTPQAPWKTLSKISGIALPAGTTRTVLVKAGTYASALDYVRRDDNSSGGVPGAGAVLGILYEPGCVMDGTAANASAEMSGVEMSGVNAWTCNITGNGLTIRNYAYNVGSASPNGIGNRGNNTTNVYGVTVRGCGDGVSAHGNARLNIYDCDIAECTKSAYAHVENSVFTATRCRFAAMAGSTHPIYLGIGTCQSSGAHTFTQCEFIPAATPAAGANLDLANATVNRCELGTLTASVTLVHSAGYGLTATINDSFVNAYADGSRFITMRRCYGKFSTRARRFGVIDVQNCVFTGPATGQTAIVFANFNDTNAAKLVFKNNIIKGPTAAQFMSVDATNAGYLVAAGSEMQNNALFPPAAYDADLITADSTGVVRAGTITADPLIGAANTLLMADYAAGSGSPVIGAATDGGNVGFAAGEAVSVGLPA